MDKEKLICQSCGMPLTEETMGTHSDGSLNPDYCCYCFKDGHFTKECTMEEMIEFCSQFVDMVNEHLPEPVTRDQYKVWLSRQFPTLKRWKLK